MPIVIETFHEFRGRMNCESITVGEGSFDWSVLYANGGVWTGNRGLDPPTDPTELFRLKRDYLKACLDRETERFKAAYEDALRIGQFSLQCENVDGLSTAVIESLRQGKQRIATMTAELAAMDKELVDPDQVAREQHRQQVIRDVHRRKQEAFRQLQQI